MRRVMRDIINSDGTFQVTDNLLRDGLEAYEKLKTTRYDGVVLDVNIPAWNGLQLLEQLQKDRIRATVIMVKYDDNQGCGCHDPGDGAQGSRFCHEANQCY